MKKILSGLLSVAFAIGLSTPAESSSSNWDVYQKTLATYSGSNTALSSLQKSQIRATLDKTPQAEKFICTGIRYYDQPMSVNIMVRKRAKEACAYAKELNPSLSTWYQNKPTKARSYAGKVLLTVKSPGGGSLVATEPIEFEPYEGYVEGKDCESNFGWQVLGKNKAGNLAYLKCSRGKFSVDRGMFAFDPKTNTPIISENLPANQKMAYSPHAYIYPQVISEEPKTPTSNKSLFSNVEPCKVESQDSDGSRDKSYGFPLPAERAKLKENFKILVLPVEPSDYKTSSKPADDLADVVDSLPKFYQRMATKPISFEWTIPDEYRPLGKTIASFNMGNNVNNEDRVRNANEYARSVVGLYDSEYDYSAFDMVIIEEPRTVPNSTHSMSIPITPIQGIQPITSDEGVVRNILNTGNDDLRDMANWYHQFGHLLGLPDRNWNVDSAPGFDIMFGWYGSPEMSMWLRWVLGITYDNQYNCVTTEQSTTHWLRPVAWDNGQNNAVVIPVDETTVIVAESRRRQGFDALLGESSEGVYVYRVDVGAKMYQPDDRIIVDSIRPERATRTSGAWSFDSQLKPGESVSSDGWTIKSLESGAFGDVIEVTKTGNPDSNTYASAENTNFTTMGLFSTYGRKDDSKITCSCCGCLP